ncbi:MAG: DUF2589 domain-containing protein [Candidatus Symbiothrix sp.]|nr:DUF2589 domain-containing protein [Candidatus Symbiothrix sp.]
MAIDTTPSQVASNALAGLPFSQIIGSPLKAAIEAQAMAAETTWKFIQEVLNTDPTTGEKKAVTPPLPANSMQKLDLVRSAHRWRHRLPTRARKTPKRCRIPSTVSNTHSTLPSKQVRRVCRKRFVALFYDPQRFCQRIDVQFKKRLYTYPSCVYDQFTTCG